MSLARGLFVPVVRRVSSNVRLCQLSAFFHSPYSRFFVTAFSSASHVSSSPVVGSAFTSPSKFDSLPEILKSCGGTTSDPLYKELARLSVQAYEKHRFEVDARILPIIAKNKKVLFLEGTVDVPGSLCSMNVVKMLTQLQALPLVAIDTTAHPAILGFALTHGKKGRSPYLFVDGVCVGGHDTLLASYKSGSLAKKIGGVLPETQSSTFKLELPIGLY